MQDSPTPPGWYPDPNTPGGQRYWDGSNWTENRAPGTPVAAAPASNGKAIASLVLGILWLCSIGSILALIFGYQAKNEIDASGGAQGGRGMAVAGIVLGWIGVGFAILYLVLWAVGVATLEISSS
jgi:Domain of unknown function (DUF4190)/Protein of unknown function (DUF2510)